MSKWIWVSELPSPSLEIGADRQLGPDWQRIGTVDTSRESELLHEIQRQAGRRGGRTKAISFYVDADETEWVTGILGGSAHSPAPWLAIDAYGNQQSYMVTRRRASFGVSMTRRPPESHPGLIGRTYPLAVRITPEPGRGMFKVIDSDLG
ncbi:hypothetical protein ACGFIF_43115 [Kribbella sp. NPDC049174]|uniref:hypothetical protein n=1 Tax=Kribbella sp. NPDC049174 TaxID=3364112 RepID=UPI00371B2636